MFANILFFTFVGIFTAIAVLGHILLVAAVWPAQPDRQRKPESEPAQWKLPPRGHFPV